MNEIKELIDLIPEIPMNDAMKEHFMHFWMTREFMTEEVIADIKEPNKYVPDVSLKMCIISQSYTNGDGYSDLKSFIIERIPVFPGIYEEAYSYLMKSRMGIPKLVAFNDLDLVICEPTQSGILLDSAIVKYSDNQGIVRYLSHPQIAQKAVRLFNV